MIVTQEIKHKFDIDDIVLVRFTNGKRKAIVIDHSPNLLLPTYLVSYFNKAGTHILSKECEAIESWMEYEPQYYREKRLGELLDENL